MEPTSSPIIARSGVDALPAGAVDLFGDEVNDAWSRADGSAAAIVVPGDGASLAAGAFVLIHQLDGERVASIRQLVVHPAHRGKGLAGRLLRAAVTFAGEQGCTRIRSTAGWGCPDHLALYHRLKWSRAAADDRPYLVSNDVAPPPSPG